MHYLPPPREPGEDGLFRLLVKLIKPVATTTSSPHVYVVPFCRNLRFHHPQPGVLLAVGRRSSVNRNYKNGRWR